MEVKFDKSFLLTCTIGLIVLIKFLPWFYNYYIFRKKINKLPGPPSYPLVGSLLSLIKINNEERIFWFKNLSFNHINGIWRLWLGNSGNVHIRKPQHLEVILSSTVNITKGMAYHIITPWLGSGLLTSKGEKWFHDRKLITPGFHFSILEQYALVMYEKAEILLQVLEKEYKKDPGRAIDVFPFVVNCTLDIICETAMGINMNAQTEFRSEYAISVQRSSALSMERLFRPWLISDFIYSLTSDGRKYYSLIKGMHQFTRDVINMRKKKRQLEGNNENGKQEEDDIGRRKRKAFLDLLLDSSENDANPLSTEELREQVDTFMFTGHDTTAAAVCWSLFCLGDNLDLQEKVHQEIEDFFGDSTEPATVKQVSQLKYLERVIKEALRLYPSAPSFSRKLETDITLDGYVIPKGCSVWINTYITHRDPEFWEDPEKFDPDRFLPDNTKDRHPYAYIPFSAGSRNCIGQKFAKIEEKILLTAILRKWRVKSVASADSVKFINAFILRPSRGIYLHLTPKTSLS